MVLNEVIKDRMRPIVGPFGEFLGRVGFTPNVLSSFGLGLGVLAGFLFALRPSQPYFAALAIIGCGFFDLLDGAVARATSRILPGSFTDQTLDRISEIAIYSGIIYGGYHISPTIVLLTLGLSMLVSYVVAKGESLEVKMSKLGIGDRADRLTGLILFAVLGYVWIAIYLNLVLAMIALASRYSYITHDIKMRDQTSKA